jgi:mycoredoxin
VGPFRTPSFVLFVIAAAVAGGVAFAPRIAGADVSSLSSSPVTVYGAKWCSACRTLESGLKERKIAFDLVDVDDNPSAFARARAASGASNAIPLTSVVRTTGNTVWIVGADIDAVQRAERGD